MKNALQKLFLLIIFLGLQESCHTSTFLPQTQNVPLFVKDSDIQITTALTYRSGELQVAYSPINHLGIIVNGQASRYSAFGEVGLGYYYCFNQKLVTETYGGYANGYNLLNADKEGYGNSLLGKTGYYKSNIDIHANRFFIQPDIGYRFTDKISLAFSIKMCYWNFPKYYYDRERWEYNHEMNRNYLQSKDSINVRNARQMTYEPSITLKVGGKYAKFMVQTGIALLSDSSAISPVPYNNFPFFIRFGIMADIDFRK